MALGCSLVTVVLRLPVAPVYILTRIESVAILLPFGETEAARNGTGLRSAVADGAAGSHAETEHI
jgi:hypothetical protein